MNQQKRPVIPSHCRAHATLYPLSPRRGVGRDPPEDHKGGKLTVLHQHKTKSNQIFNFASNLQLTFLSCGSLWDVCRREMTMFSTRCLEFAVDRAEATSLYKKA